MAPSAPSASFASLPPELRVEIFRYVLASERAFRGEIRTRVHVKRRRERSFPGRYLRVCKLFNAEAAPILYSQHRFYFRTLYGGMVFMRRIGRTNLSCVKGLHFGTFWITASEGRRLWGVYSSTDWCRKDVVDEIQQFAPSLTHLQFASITPHHENRSYLKMLEGCRYAMEKLPKLTKAYYRRSSGRVVLSTGAINAASLVSTLNDLSRLRLTYTDLRFYLFRL